MKQWIEPMYSGFNTQAGYTITSFLGRLISKLFNLPDRAVVNVVLGGILPYVIKKFLKWKLPNEFVGGMFLNGFDGLATIINNAVSSTKQDVTVNGLLANVLSFPTSSLAGDKALGQDTQYLSLPNGMVVAPLPNGNYIDMQGNVYTLQELQNMSQMMLPQQQYRQQPILYGDDKEEEDQLKTFELLFGKMQKNLDNLLGETKDDNYRNNITLNGSYKENNDVVLF
jgi:hypothetical protein